MQEKGIRPLPPAAELCFTDRPVSGWGGLALVGRFFDHLRLGERLEMALPDGRTSPNQRSVREIALSLFATVLTGGSRFSHVERLRQDEVVRTALRIEKVPSEVTLCRYFSGFRQQDVEHLTDVLWPLWSEGVAPIEGGGVLDLDSTVLERYGRQEGSLKGHNPRRHGRPSHHPLLAMLAETKQIAHVWLRSGNSGTARGVNEFLAETLARLPSAIGIRAVRADSGFFIASFLEMLEGRGLSYAIAVRANPQVRRAVAEISEWRSFGVGLEVGEMLYKAHGWSVPRRIVVVREEIAQRPDARGRRLFELPDYTFHFVVTSLDLAGEEVWRFYNQRAECENRLKELKTDFGASGFCLRSFFGTEAVLRLICLLFNWMVEFKTRILGDPKPQLATVRNRTLVLGAIRGAEARKIVLRIGARGSFRESIEAAIERLQAFSATALQLLERLRNQPMSPPGNWRWRRPEPPSRRPMNPAPA